MMRVVMVVGVGVQWCIWSGVEVFACSGGEWSRGGAMRLPWRFGREEARVFLGRRRIKRGYKEDRGAQSNP